METAIPIMSAPKTKPKSAQVSLVIGVEFLDIEKRLWELLSLGENKNSPKKWGTRGLYTLFLEFLSVEIPLAEWQERHFIRVLIQWYNTQADVNTLVEALEKLLPVFVEGEG